MEIITLTPDIVPDYGFCGYKDAAKHVEMRRKGEWYKEYYPNGLRIKALLTPDDSTQGMIENIDG